MSPEVREMRAHLRSRLALVAALALLAAGFGIVGWKVDPAALAVSLWRSASAAVVRFAQHAPELARSLLPALEYLPQILFFVMLFGIWLALGDIFRTRKKIRLLNRSSDILPAHNVSNLPRQ